MDQVILIEQLGSQEEIANYVRDQEAEGTINLLAKEERQQRMSVTNSMGGSTVAAAGLIHNEIHMAIRVLEGYFKGSLFTLDPSKSYKGYPEQNIKGFSVGKWKPKQRDLAFPREVGGISKDHGLFYFDT